MVAINKAWAGLAQNRSTMLGRKFSPLLLGRCAACNVPQGITTHRGVPEQRPRQLSSCEAFGCAAGLKHL